MNIFECEQYAKDNGYDSVKFKGNFPAGTFNCRWLDAYFGLLTIEGLDGFVTSKKINQDYPNATFEIEED